MAAFVIALQARGELTSVTMTVYTSGIVGGYCTVNQIDPVE
jgi:hypothetical protein